MKTCLMLKHWRNLGGASFLYCFVILIIFHFPHASIISTIGDIVVSNLNRIYYNIHHNLLFIYLVINFGIIT